MYEVFVKPFNAWALRTTLKEEGKELILAINRDCGLEIYLDKDFSDNTYCINVSVDGELVEYEEVHNEPECRDVLIKFYDYYLSGDFLSSDTWGSDNEDQDIDFDKLVEDREWEIDGIIEDLIDVLSPDDSQRFLSSPNIKETFKEIKEDLSTYFTIKHKLPIYRPTYIVENGESILMDYPYEMLSDEKDIG